MAFAVMLVTASCVGAILGAVGAAAKRVKTWDEFLLWVIGGVMGGALAVVGWTGVVLGVSALAGLTVGVVTATTVGLTIFATAGLIGAVLSPRLDTLDGSAGWWFSFVIKWVQSPLLTTVGLIAAIGSGKVDFRRGMLFIGV